MMTGEIFPILSILLHTGVIFVAFQYASWLKKCVGIWVLMASFLPMLLTRIVLYVRLVAPEADHFSSVMWLIENGIIPCVVSALQLTAMIMLAMDYMRQLAKVRRIHRKWEQAASAPPPEALHRH